MNYAALAKTAQRLLKGAGRTITINRYAPSRNSATGGITKGGPIQQSSPYAVELPAAKGLQIFKAQLAAESIVVQQWRFFAIAASDQPFAPLPQDELVVDNELWSIKGVDSYMPATVPIIYNVMVAH